MAEVTVVVPPAVHTGTVELRDPLGRSACRFFAKCETCGWLQQEYSIVEARISAYKHKHPPLIIEVDPRG